VVTRSADLDPHARLFTETSVRPIVLACEVSPPDRRERLSEVADVLVVGAEDVDIALALDALAERGLRRVICEGGPHLLGWLVAAGKLDELCLTLSPLIAGGEAGRIVAGIASQVADPMRLLHVLEADGHLFLRYSTAAR
jgi:riboflavin biosynthesis pyrimidine reductase